MKRFSFKFLAVALLVAVTAYSCIDDKFDTPPIAELPEGSIVTIQKLRDLCPPGNTYKIEGDTSLYAVVTMDEMSGNIYRNIFVQDNTGAVNLRFGSTSGLYEGDSIRLYLKGAVLSWYNNLFQIDSLHADYNVVKQATDKHIAPEVVTISQIKSDLDYFQSRLVKIEDVQVRASDTASIWAPYQQYGEIYIEDTDGNDMMIRTSGYAKFAGENVPNGFGSITAIVGLYRETVQLGIRRTSEVDLYGERWEPVLTGSGTKEDPWDVETGISLQNKDPREVGWVKGFIVGTVKNGTSSVTSTSDIEFSAPFTGYTNVVLADNPDERELAKLLIVNLPSGKPLRSQVNLLDNPDNIGKWLNVSGTLRTYFGIAGSRDGSGESSDFEIEGGNGGGDDDPITPVTSISEDFQGYSDNGTINQNGWSSLAEAGSRVWNAKAYNDERYAQATAYNASDASLIMWLITPPIDFDQITDPKLTFKSAQAYYTHDGFSLHYSTDYDGTNIATATWQPLSATLAGDADAEHAWVNSGVVDIPVNSGIGYIAWKYVGSGTGGQTGTFRVDDVELYDAVKK